MSKVHDAMRSLEHRSVPESTSGNALRNLVGALIEELMGELPDDPELETVRADLLAASRSYETGKKKDLALRFYLAIRTLIHEHELLQERLKKAERRNRALEVGTGESGPSPASDRQEEKPAVQTFAAAAGTDISS